MKVWGGRSSGQVQAPCGRRWLPHAWPATQLAAVRAGPACSVRPDQSRIGLPRDARGACPRSGVCGQHWGQTVPGATLQRLSGAGSLALRGRAAAATRVFGINIEVRAPSLPSPQPPLRSPALPWPLCLKHLQGNMSTTKCGRAVLTSPKSFLSSMSTLNSHRGGWGGLPPSPSVWAPPRLTWPFSVATAGKPPTARLHDESAQRATVPGLLGCAFLSGCPSCPAAWGWDTGQRSLDPWAEPVPWPQGAWPTP